MKVAFFLNWMCERGVPTAIYDYAYFNEKLLNNKSIIIYQNNIKNNPDVISKFKNIFDTRTIDEFAQIENFHASVN